MSTFRAQRWHEKEEEDEEKTEVMCAHLIEKSIFYVTIFFKSFLHTLGTI